MKKLIIGIIIILAAITGIGCSKANSPTGPSVNAMMAIQPPAVQIGTAQNVAGTVWVTRANEVDDRRIISGSKLYDDDQIKLTPGSNYEAVSIYGAPTVKISYGDNGYWNAQTGTKNPPSQDWIYCRGTSYASSW